VRRAITTESDNFARRNNTPNLTGLTPFCSSGGSIGPPSVLPPFDSLEVVMPVHSILVITILAMLQHVLVDPASAASAEFASYPPLRILPAPSNRPAATGPAHYVDPVRGADSQDGSRQKPWKTLGHALRQLRPGDTLYLRGGVYWERVTAAPQGTPEAPITVCSYPGELAVLDGGHREFFQNPAGAWEPVAAGAPDEYRSTKSYPDIQVGGNFGDSLVPLRMYGSFVDLRAQKEHELKPQPAGEGTYVGPGVKRDEATGRIHIRLSHTTLPGLGDENYRGATDPRRLPLVIAADGVALDLRDARHLRLHDLVVRGATRAIELSKSEGIELDGVTAYAVRFGMIVSEVDQLTVRNCAFRGFDAPWHPRASGTDVDCFCPLDLVTVESGGDLEFDHNEFTDHHDCIQIGDIRSLAFHHNLVERFNDDGIDFSFAETGAIRIYANRIARCLTPFSIHQGGPAADELGGVFIYRNIIDLRRGIYSHPPATHDEPNDENAAGSLNRQGHLIGDHGSPTWPPIYFYQNTVLQTAPALRFYYAGGLGYAGLRDSRRRVFNNVFVHHRLGDAKNGALIAANAAEVDLAVDGNLFWGLIDGSGAANYLERFRKSKDFETSKARYAAGWTAHDLVADPRFKQLSTDRIRPTDLALDKSSPAVNAGAAVPSDWPDELRNSDEAAPDLGAVPLGIEPWTIGMRGRLPLFP